MTRAAFFSKNQVSNEFEMTGNLFECIRIKRASTETTQSVNAPVFTSVLVSHHRTALLPSRPGRAPGCKKNMPLHHHEMHCGPATFFPLRLCYQRSPWKWLKNIGIVINNCYFDSRSVDGSLLCSCCHGNPAILAHCCFRSSTLYLALSPVAVVFTWS